MTVVHRLNRYFVAVVMTAAPIAALTGCASAPVRKVPSPTQYVINGKSYWTVEMQREADRMEGIRFYLPRPFINVFESFPVAADIYLAKGRVSPDGRFVAIDSVMPLSTREDFDGVRASAARVIPQDLQIPRDWIFRAGAARQVTDTGQARSATEGAGALAQKVQEAIEESRENADDAKKQRQAAQDAAASAAASAGKTEEPGPTTGQNRREVKNDNGAFAYQPLRGNFDLVYLPDFDEQYVASSRSGLGNAQFQLNLGQGWSLQGYNSFTDNSELTKRVFDVIDTGLELGKAAARAAALSAGIPLPIAGQARAGAETAPESMRMQEAAGTPVSLKIVVVHYAAKGLYPVIKPRELIGRSGAELVMDLAADEPKLRRLNDRDYEVALAEHARIERRSTVPVYPYQYVSFNTFRYMAIEVLTPAGSPFGNMYDKTGTTGDAGDRRASDPTPGTGPTPPPPPPTELDGALKALQDDAVKAANAKIDSELTTVEASKRPRITKVLLSESSTGAEPVAGGSATWTGPADSLSAALQDKLREEIGRIVRDNGDVKKHNKGKELKLSGSFNFSHVTVTTDPLFLTVALTAALDAAEATATTESQKALDALPGATAGALRVTAVDLVIDSAGVPTANVTLSGTSTVPQQEAIKTAIIKAVESDAEVTKHNGNQPLKIAAFTFAP